MLWKKERAKFCVGVTWFDPEGEVYAPLSGAREEEKLEQPNSLRFSPRFPQVTQEHGNPKGYMDNMQRLSVLFIHLFIPSFNRYLLNNDGVHWGCCVNRPDFVSWMLCSIFLTKNLLYGYPTSPKSMQVPQRLELISSSSPVTYPSH